MHIDKLRQFKGLFRFQPHGVELVGFEQDIAAAFILETFQNLVGIDRADASHCLFIFDRFAGGLVNLPKGDA